MPASTATASTDHTNTPSSSGLTTTSEPSAELSLDISIVETGAATEALLCSTDNGCDTQKNGDC